MQAAELPLSHEPVSEVIYIRNNPLFPISWLHKQEFCEYQIFLENVKGIRLTPTKAMVEGKQEHEHLYDEFKKAAVPTTFGEMLEHSKTATAFSREFRVCDTRHGIYGRIDEVSLTPEEFIVIDDKPGTKTYLSNIHQVYGYCLAFREIALPMDARPVVAALRERRTNNLFWKAPFDQLAEEQIVAVIDHIHALISGNAEFSSADNPNKCKGCRLNAKCNRVAL